MGVPRAVQASPMPSMAWENCHITSGFSGLPKLRQLVAAMGRAPEAATLRAASATACMAPTFGLRKHQRPLPSVERAVSFHHEEATGGDFTDDCGIEAPLFEDVEDFVLEALYSDEEHALLGF